MAEQKNLSKKVPVKAEENRVRRTGTIETRAIKTETVKAEPKEEKGWHRKH